MAACIICNVTTPASELIFAARGSICSSCANKILATPGADLDLTFSEEVQQHQLESYRSRTILLTIGTVAAWGAFGLMAAGVLPPFGARVLVYAIVAVPFAAVFDAIAWRAYVRRKTLRERYRRGEIPARDFTPPTADEAVAELRRHTQRRRRKIGGFIAVLAVIAAIQLVRASQKADPKPVTYTLGQVGPNNVLGPHTRFSIDGKTEDYESVFKRPPPKNATVTLLFDTPCGTKTSDAFPLPPLEAGDTNATIEPPSTLDLPLVTTVLVDPVLTKSIKIGSITIDPKAQSSTDIVDISCVSSFTVGDTPVEMPKITKGMGDDVKYSIFVNDRPDQCFMQRYVTYVKEGRNTNLTVPPRRLQGARVYEVGGDYVYWFKPVPAEIESHSSDTQLRGAFDVCPTDVEAD